MWSCWSPPIWTIRTKSSAFYLPVKDDPEACGVAYMAVDASHRRQGVARKMLREMVGRYPHAELTCAVAKVPYFEAMGFQVVGVRATQVLMNTRDHGSDGLMALLDVASIYSSLEVRQIHTYLLQKHGKRAMLDAEKQRDRHLDQLTRKANEFVRERLGTPPCRPLAHACAWSDDPIETVGASLLAKNARTPRAFRRPALSLTSIAGRPASTRGGFQAAQSPAICRAFSGLEVAQLKNLKAL
jgi:hypothetical protein